jgi:hypothetical protein
MMRKLLFNLMLVLAVLLAACAQATPGGPQAAANPAPATRPAAVASATVVTSKANSPIATQAVVQTPVATRDANSPTMDCQVVSISPTQGPTEASMFPPPTKDDWVLGQNPSAPLTITEYSDFQ